MLVEELPELSERLSEKEFASWKVVGRKVVIGGCLQKSFERGIEEVKFETRVVNALSETLLIVQPSPSPLQHRHKFSRQSFSLSQPPFTNFQTNFQTNFLFAPLSLDSRGSIRIIFITTPYKVVTRKSLVIFLFLFQTLITAGSSAPTNNFENFLSQRSESYHKQPTTSREIGEPTRNFLTTLPNNFPEQPPNNSTQQLYPTTLPNNSTQQPLLYDLSLKLV